MNESASSAARGEQHGPRAGIPSSTLAGRINHLFDTVTRPDGSRHSNDEVAAAMGGTADGPQISGAYLSLLRRGVRDNPTKKHLEALARFFSVSPAYFFDDAEFEAIAEQLQLLRLLADSRVKQVATRLGGLSRPSIDNILDLVERVRALEGLDAKKSDHDDDR